MVWQSLKIAADRIKESQKDKEYLSLSFEPFFNKTLSNLENLYRVKKLSIISINLYKIQPGIFAGGKT